MMTIATNIGGWLTCSGAHCSLVLDPSAEPPRVYTLTGVGSGCPSPVYHRLHLDLGSVNLEADPDSLQEWVLGQEETILAIAAGYKGSEWNDHNHVGVWTPEAQELAEAFHYSLAEAFEHNAIAVTWDAADYFDPAESDVLAAAVQDASLAAAVEREEKSAAGEGYFLRDTEEALRAILQDVVDDAEDELPRTSYERRILQGARRLLELPLISNEELEDFRNAAAEADDSAQVILCDLALAGDAEALKKCAAALVEGGAP